MIRLSNLVSYKISDSYFEANYTNLIANIEYMYISKKGEQSPTYSQIMNRLSIINQRDFYSGGLPKSDEKIATRYNDSFNKMLEVIFELQFYLLTYLHKFSQPP